MSTAATVAAPAQPQPIGKLSGRDVTRVVGELSDLLDAGCPVSRALAVLRRQATRPPVRTLLARLEADVLNGSSLADAMARTGGRFSGVHVAMVRASEMGGFLTETLAHMAEHGRQRQDLVRQVKGAMTYPAVLLITAVASIAFLLGFVVPRFSRVYEAAGATLPWPTQLLMSVSHAVAAWWWAGLAAIAIAIVGGRLGLRAEKARLRLDRLWLRTPVAAPLVREWAVGEFCRSMALLLSGGVTVLSSLKLAGEVVGNRVMRSSVAAVADGVQQGEPMGRLMDGSPLFAPATVELIAIAEESGNLPAVMQRLAAQSKRRLESRLAVLMSLVEPTIVLAVGILVALIVAGMLLPVLLMSTLVE